MATNFPTSVDDASTVGDDTHPSADELLSSTDGGPAHHALHQNVGLAINAIEDKVGTGASTPVVGSVLTGTGSGTSGWSTDPLYVDETNSRVGIGTTSPGEPLHIVTSSDDAFLKQENGTTTTFSGPDSANTGLYGTSSNHDTRFITNNTERVRIDTSGRVGIGTTSPAHPLHVTGSDNRPIRAESSVSGSYIDIQDSATTGEGYVGIGAVGNDLRFIAGGDTKLSVDSSGEIGIGTTTPGAKLHVVSGTTDNTAIFESTDAAAYISVKDNSTSGNNQVAIGAVGDDMRLRAGGVNRVAVMGATGRVGINTTSPSTTLHVNGSLSKASGSFRIPHPLPAKAETHDLVHSFVEAPQADNLYRGQVALTDGAATVDLDAAAGMTTGTFPLLNRDVQCFIANNQGWTAVRGSVSGSTLSIEAQDASCDDTVDWLVIGERHDQHMFDTEWTDDNGRVIVEPLRPPAPEPDPEAA